MMWQLNKPPGNSSRVKLVANPSAAVPLNMNLFNARCQQVTSTSNCIG